MQRLSLTWLPVFQTYSSHLTASSSLHRGEGASSHWKLICHGMLTSMGVLPKSEHNKKGKSGWGSGGGEGTLVRI